MFLESITLNNFRKFGKNDNTVFLAYEKFRDQEKKDEINISATSTLIVGKNNVGKTSVISAIKKLVGEDNFKSTDFNFRYLMQFLNEFNNNPDMKLPEISFTINIKLDDQEDIISNVAPLLYLNNTESATLHVKVKLKEEEEFKKKVSKIASEDKGNKFKLLLDAIDDIGLEEHHYNNDNQEIKKFNLKDLIEISPIEANKITQQNSLTEAFNKIIQFRYNSEKEVNGLNINIEKELEEINNTLTTNFEKNHEDFVNDSLGEIRHIDNLEIKLTSNLTHDNLLGKNILLYEFVEEGLRIPESQYGLGYTNLVMIIAKIIEYIEKSPKESFTSKINLISIEEPETYMHPQMQELFIRNINDAITQLLVSQDKYINSQIIITTHSSHILNSKIHSGNSFDYINYFTNTNTGSEIVPLKDDTILGRKSAIDSIEVKEIEKREVANLNFLKKHIKYKVSELFFSDAIIFVEGVTEETLIKHWIETDDDLKFYYISIFNINGSHGLVYHHLIEQIKVPSLIITDLDIKKKTSEDNEDKEQETKQKENEENDKDLQPIKDLENYITTNKTLIKYFGKNLKNYHMNRFERTSNMYLTYQREIENIYPTSFEESLILTNYENEVLKSALEKTNPTLYKNYHAGKDENLKQVSRKFQKKLNASKSEFANRLLFELVGDENMDKELIIPNYIKDGLDWLKGNLKGEQIRDD